MGIAKFSVVTTTIMEMPKPVRRPPTLEEKRSHCKPILEKLR